MANGAFNGWGGVVSSPGFNVVGAGDINRDGFADIVVENFSTGEIDYGNMANGMFNGWVHVVNSPGWKVAAVEDVVGNGFDDIVVQNSTTGQIYYANMTTGAFQGWGTVGTTPGYTALSQPGPASAAAGRIPDSGAMYDGIASAVSASDPGSQNGGTANNVSTIDPASQIGDVVSDLTMSDLAAPNGGMTSAITMSEFGAAISGTVPSITLQDPGSLSGVPIQYAGSSNGGSPGPNGGAPSAAASFDTGPQNVGNPASCLTDVTLSGVSPQNPTGFSPVTDPQNGPNGLSMPAFDAATTLGYLADANTEGTVLATNGAQGANIAMLGSYMASTFPTPTGSLAGQGADGLAGNSSSLLTHPQHA